MAYLSQAQELDGLFSFVGTQAAALLGKKVAQAQQPAAPKPPGILPLQQSKPSMPLGMDFSKIFTTLPPKPQPIPVVPAAPKAQVSPAANVVQNVTDMVAAAMRSMRSGEQPLATAIGTNLARPKPAPSPTATRVPQAPSGSPPSSPPVDVQTRAVVNGSGQTVMPMLAPEMPGWVIPVAIGGGVLALYMLSRR